MYVSVHSTRLKKNDINNEFLLFTLLRCKFGIFTTFTVKCLGLIIERKLN